MYSELYGRFLRGTILFVGTWASEIEKLQRELQIDLLASGAQGEMNCFTSETSSPHFL